MESNGGGRSYDHLATYQHVVSPHKRVWSGVAAITSHALCVLKPTFQIHSERQFSVGGNPAPSACQSSAFRAPLRKFEHKARRRRMRKQPILCIGDARLGGSDAAARVEYAALGADHATRLAHAAHE